MATKKPRRFSFLSLIFLLVLIPSVVLNIFLSGKLKKSKEGIKVVGVIDGDTIVLEGKVKLRLRSVDAPELDYCLGQEARDFVVGLVEGKKVLVREQIYDVRGRPMSLIYVNGRLVNKEVLEQGFGRFHSDDTTVREELKTAYNEAREKSLGIFSPECFQKINLENPECNIKGNIDKNSTRRNYYFPGCAQYNFTIVEKDIGEAWFCTEEEAIKAGFTRAKTCP